MIWDRTWSFKIQFFLFLFSTSSFLLPLCLYNMFSSLFCSIYHEIYSFFYFFFTHVNICIGFPYVKTHRLWLGDLCREPSIRTFDSVSGMSCSLTCTATETSYFNRCFFSIQKKRVGGIYVYVGNGESLIEFKYPYPLHKWNS